MFYPIILNSAYSNILRPKKQVSIDQIDNREDKKLLEEEKLKSTFVKFELKSFFNSLVELGYRTSFLNGN